MVLEGQKILVTGASGRVAFPIARALAQKNEVWGVARFTDPGSPSRLEAAGVRPVALDVSAAGFSTLPDDFHHVFPAYPEPTDMPADVLVAKYRWARNACLI